MISAIVSWFHRRSKQRAGRPAIERSCRRRREYRADFIRACRAERCAPRQVDRDAIWRRRRRSRFGEPSLLRANASQRRQRVDAACAKQSSDVNQILTFAPPRGEAALQARLGVYAAQAPTVTGSPMPCSCAVVGTVAHPSRTYRPSAGPP